MANEWESFEGLAMQEEPEPWDVKTRMESAWKALMEVLKENPEKTIAEFIEYSRSANIRRFSLLNRFFLYSQSGGRARFVLTRKAWEKLGRTVKAGEEPIRVFVLLPINRGRAWAKSGKGRRRRRSGSGEFFIYLEHEEFDVSQTEGPQIPEPVSKESNSAAARRLVEALEEHCRESLLEVTHTPLLGSASSPEEVHDRASALGGTDGRRIFVRKGLAGVQQARVLAHELAHIRMGHLDSLRDPADGEPPALLQAQREVEAEAVACLVCAAWGVDISEESLYYLMLFKERDIPVEAVSQKIFHAVRTLLGSLQPAVLPGHSPS